jgi:hypothetical protein
VWAASMVAASGFVNHSIQSIAESAKQSVFLVHVSTNQFLCAARRDEANEALKAAQEAGNQEEIEKYSKRTVKVCVFVPV